MATKKFIQISTAGSIVAGTYFIAVNDQGAGVGVDYRFSLADLAAAVSGSLYALITCGSDGVTITDPFIDADVKLLLVNGVGLVAGQDFTVTGNTATITNGSSVYSGLIIFAQK